MPPVQTASDYAINHPEAYEGAVADAQLTNIVSKIAEGSDILPGLAIVAGATDDAGKIPTATGQRFVGVSTRRLDDVSRASDDAIYTPQNGEVSVLDFGVVWVICEDGCVPGDAAFFRHTAAGAEVAGAFRTDADGTDADAVPGGVFVSTAAAGALAKLRIR